MFKPIDRGFALYPDEQQIREEMLREFTVLSPKPNFIFVDYLYDTTDWVGQGNNTPLQLETETCLLYNGDSGNKEDILTLCKGFYSQGNGVVWYGIEPSIATIYISPETFQRFMWNGTSFEVYDDVDEIVPKWLYYKALLTQVDNTIISRVFNKDEKDYLGDINWLRTDAGFYSGICTKSIMDLLVYSKPFSINLIQGQEYGDILMGYLYDIKAISIIFFNPDGSPLDGLNSFIELKQRMRGAPPKLISAETNTAGDNVILTFDKKLNNFVLGDPDGFFAKSSGTLIGGEPLRSQTINDKTVTFNIQCVNYGDLITVGINENCLESFDYGLIQSFDNFPVTNNVPIPLTITDSYTNSNGTEITLEFNYDIATVEHDDSTGDTAFVVSDDADGVGYYVNAPNFSILNNKIKCLSAKSPNELGFKSG